MSFNKKNQLAVIKAPEPTLAERHHRAAADVSTALSLFTDAADLLDRAAANLDQISDEAQAVADEHANRARAAGEQADANRARATKIRNFLTI